MAQEFTAAGIVAQIVPTGAALGARVRVRSRWLHAISVDAPSAALHPRPTMAIR